MSSGLIIVFEKAIDKFFRKKGSLHMAKKTKVVFELTDGRAPHKTHSPGEPFGLRTPIPIHLKGRTAGALISLGISFDRPVLVTREAWSQIFAPNQQIVVSLSSGEGGLDLSEGEVVAKAFVFDNSDFDI